MHIEVFDTFNAAEAHWRQAEREGFTFPYQRFDWLSRWHEEIGQSGTCPQIVVIFDDAKCPVLLLPLGIERRHGIRVLGWLGRGVNDLQSPVLGTGALNLLSDETFAGLWQEARSLLLPHDVVHLTAQPQVLLGYPNPFVSIGTARHEDTSYQATLTRDWDTYYETRISRSIRRSSLRRRRRLGEEAETRTVIATDETTAEWITERMMQQKSQKFRQTEAPDIFARDEYRRFYLRVATECLQSELVHIAALMHGEELIATDWSIYSRTWIAGLFSGHEAGSWERFSPGTILREDVLRWSCEHGIEVSDYSVGEEPYKQDWTDSHTRLYENVRATSTAGLSYALPLLGHRHLKAAAMTYAPAAHALRTAKRRLRTLVS